MKKRIIYLFYFISFMEITEAVTPKDFKLFLENLDTVSVIIEQTRYVQALNKSFTSTSEAELFHKKGVVKWKDSSNNSFISTKTEYKVNNEKNKNLDDLPYFSDIKEIIDELLSGNINALNDVAELSYAEKLILVPTISEISDHILKILIDLDQKKLNSIEIYYKNGDKILLKFHPKEINENIPQKH